MRSLTLRGDVIGWLAPSGVSRPAQHARSNAFETTSIAALAVALPIAQSHFLFSRS
jgi:hypothetical protein